MARIKAENGGIEVIPQADRSSAGSFFCTKCGMEYRGKAGKCKKCKSKGTVEFISENDCRYAKFALQSKKKGEGDLRLAYYRPFAKNSNNKEERPWL